MCSTAPTEAPASTSTSANTARSKDTDSTSARAEKKLKERLARGLRPKFLRHNLWTDGDYPTARSVADWTETAAPLPSPPQSELDDPVVKQTIAEHPELFKIVTPINVDRFEELLRDHPNPAFVASVCRGLREGFWPWADTHKDGYPVTHDASLPPPRDQREADFLESQRQEEIAKGRFSPSFGPDLLPGMYSMPIHAVPKPNSDDLRMVTDQSAGEFSLNSMIPREAISGYPLDNMKRLGELLLHIRKTEGNGRLVMIKSDVAEAYRLMPMHPHWQIKQVNTINGTRNVDRNNTFGGRGSGCIWIAFNGLVTWIAIHVRGLVWLCVYSDDSFMPEWSDRISWDPIFQKELPSSQVQLLELWRELGIPYKEKKQISGSPLTVIGIDVDPNAMTLTLPPKARADLLAEITDFCHLPDGVRGVKHTLRRWQRLAGWLNWAFNVFPLLRPCLNNFYPKIAGKDAPNQTIWTNVPVRRDLEWAANHIRTSDGVHLLRSFDWGIDDADVVIFCDACLEGMDFWYPNLDSGFYAPVPVAASSEFISVYEALCVLSTLEHASSRLDAPSRIIIFTDNSNTVDMFASLRAPPQYNEILKASVDIRLATEHQLRVLHVPGKRNEVADAISRRLFAQALTLRPQLTFTLFEPPRVTLGAARK
jgi:hypothetical protein